MKALILLVAVFAALVAASATAAENAPDQRLDAAAPTSIRLRA